MSSEPPPPVFGRPAARVIPLRDFTEASAMFPSWDGQFEQLSRGRFEGALQVVRGVRVRLIGIQANQRVRLHGRDVAGLLSVYPVTEGNGGSLWQYRRLAPGQLVVHGPAAEADHFSARQSDTLGVSLRPETMEEAARTLLNTDGVALPRTWAALSPPPDAVAGLNRHLLRLLKMGLADPTILGTAEGVRLEQECNRALVASLFSSAPRQQVLPLPARSLLLRRAEELMRARLADPVGAIDLCRELGVSDRTLRLAFCEQYGLGPLAFYKELRLNAVRYRLRENSAVAIAAAAQEYGFHHLGNFAAHYRRLFGELPSETARRISDGLRPSPDPGEPSG
jgi:AraC family ethanolamine operon transcriptional activator